MEPISVSVKKKDHAAKLTGSALYVADHPSDGVLCGKLYRSTKAHAKILAVHIPPLPEGYFVADKTDVPGRNNVQIVKDDIPVFARGTVEFIGDVILMVAGPEEREVDRILSEIRVDYEDLPAVLDMEKSDTVFFEYNYAKGDVEKAFAEADKVYDETFRTGYQEQAYLEPQGMEASVDENGKVTVHGSMQCPYYVHGAVAAAMGVEAGKVRIIQDVTGGGFGGKEAFPSILACQVAVMAKKAGKPVRVIFSRREDLEFTSKRHPSVCRYRMAVKDGRVTAMDADILFNSGAYTTLSAVVLQRGLIAAQGVYAVDNLKVHGRAVKTNTVHTGAYRGFGAPQVFFAVEMMMDHIAKDLGVDSLAFRERQLVRQGDATSTSGRYHFPVPLKAMIDEVDKASDYRAKRAAYDKPQTGRYRKGIGMSLFFHGAGFTGSQERDKIKATVKLQKYADGRVEVLASNTDIGQGLKTTFSKIAARELNIPLERVFCENPDTDRVPDSGPTVASRSLMTVGELVRRAAIKLAAQWAEGEDQMVEEHYLQPDYMIPFDLDTFNGDAYPTYAWGVNAVEVEVDTYTGQSKVLGAWGSFDVGTPVDMNIVVGQMEGGFLQGLGYASIEQMAADSRGRIRNNSFSDYIIPTAVDVPNLQVIMHVEPFPDGPYGAKGAGELPLVGAAPAYVEAVENALGVPLDHAPFTAEDVLHTIREVK